MVQENQSKGFGFTQWLALGHTCVGGSTKYVWRLCSPSLRSWDVRLLWNHEMKINGIPWKWVGLEAGLLWREPDQLCFLICSPFVASTITHRRNLCNYSWATSPALRCFITATENRQRQKPMSFLERVFLTLPLSFKHSFTSVLKKTKLWVDHSQDSCVYAWKLIYWSAGSAGLGWGWDIVCAVSIMLSVILYAQLIQKFPGLEMGKKKIAAILALFLV